VRKFFFPFILGTVFLFPCFSQNMLLLGGEYNFLKPQFFGAGPGFNFKLFNEYIQNDFTINFGGLWIKDVEDNDANGEPGMKFLFTIRDGFYFSFDWKLVGVRAGVFALLGVYGITDSAKSWDMVCNPGGFAGVCLFPKSLVSVVVDVCPGYLIAFRASENTAENDAGFSLPVYLGIRFNLDKL